MQGLFKCCVFNIKRYFDLRVGMTSETFRLALKVTKLLFLLALKVIKQHANYPMRVKVTSDRQQRWVKELLIEKINKEDLTLLQQDKPVATTSNFEHLKNKKKAKSFKQKLKLSPVAKERFIKLKQSL